MEQRLDCPICGGLEAQTSWALVAPFLRSYALNPDAPRTAQLRECHQCGHRFFRERMSEEELNRLYRDYRGERYLRERRRWEPWYTRAVNQATLQTSVADARKEALRDLLRQAGWAPGERRLIVDIGGDRGQCIPLDFSDGAYVLEASAMPSVPGVERINSLTELPQQAGLVLCQHVLEHLPDPVGFLKQIVQSGQLDPGCLVVLEVPLERPWLGPGLDLRLYRGWLELVGRWRWLAVGFDFLATAARLITGYVAPPLFAKLHEHVGFFTEASLNRIVHSAGLTVLYGETLRDSRWFTHRGVIQVVAQQQRSGSGPAVQG